MRVVNKGATNYLDLLKIYPYVFSVKDYTYLLTDEEWEATPIVNQQPPFNPDTQYLHVVMEEQNGQPVRRWVVADVPPPEVEVSA